MKVVIAGSRHITDIKYIEEAVKKSKFNITELVSGGAGGVDKLGEEYAIKNCIPIKNFIPDWNNTKAKNAIIKTNKFGKKYNANAGFERNEKMAEYMDACIAIMDIDNDTPGTSDMIKRAKNHNKECFIFRIEREDNEYSYIF